MGYLVTRTGGNGPDGGVDLILAKDSETFLVQCKQWRAFRVGVDVVRELYGVMAAQGSTGGFVVTSGRFTQEAQEFARGRNIRLIDGPELQSLLQQSPHPSAVRPSAASVPSAAPDDHPTPALQRPSAPCCPRCGKPMVERTARRGPTTGETFWGCPDYPACRGIRSRSA